MKLAVLMALMGYSMSGAEAKHHSLIQSEVDLYADPVAKKEKAAEQKKKAAKSSKSKTEGDNMDSGEKDDNEAVPDVSVDDQTDPNNKPFFLVLNGKTKRKVFMSKEKIGIDRVAKIKEKAHPRNSVFLYDKRTKTIRLASERNFALSNKMGKGMKAGHAAVFRRVLNQQVTDDQKLTINKAAISNKAKRCLMVNGKNKDMSPLQWWACNKNPLQNFAKIARDATKTKPDFTKQRFTINLQAKGKRNVYLSKEKNGEDFVLKLEKKPKHWRSWFIMDKRTSSIRVFTQRHLAISNLAGKNVKPGASLVVRKFSDADKSQALVINGHRIQNKHSKRCLSTQNNENKDNINLTFWPCNGKDTQKWQRTGVEGSYEELCNDVLREGKRYRVCPGKKDKFLGEHCTRHVEQRKSSEVLVKKCGEETWDIAKCNRFSQKGEWFRKCGESHLTPVSGPGQ